MVFPIPHEYKTAILRQYHKNISRYPVICAEVEAFLEGKEEDFSLCLQYLYGHMAAQDVLSTPVEVFSDYVQATLKACQTLHYLRNVPPEIFFPYVLYHRVNSECLDNSRGFLFAELLPHVQRKSMEQAALSVNYWCYAHATYTPADVRTLGPLAILRRTLGRCGEESVLAVAALRSAGIPARQCYCPRWSHCDDNHAWVEVWIDDTWHYLGACEPEPVLNRGWFTAAASRAMLVDTKCWADWNRDALYQTVNCTAHYTKTQTFTVQVTENGLPVNAARVRFQIVNYSELYTLWEALTDEQGYARFETGPGDLFVYAQYGQKVALKKADLRLQNSITLELQESFPECIVTDLVPPEDSSGEVPHQDPPHHKQLLSLCEAHLASRRAAFSENQGCLQHAALNVPALQAFLEDDRHSYAHKEELLSTLRPKDFVDITHETLTDALEIASSARGLYPDDIFRNYLLAPRIADEMLLPHRQKIRDLFPQGFENPGEILTWMHSHMQVLPDEGIRNYYPSAFGCLRCRQVPAFAWDMVFVALCRAFCFPARLDPHTGEAQWMDHHNTWHPIRPGSLPVCLTLEIPTGVKLNYSEHITLGRWNSDDFSTLTYPNLTIEGRHAFSLQSGYYRITVTTRQIDGTASVSVQHITLHDDLTLQILPPEDQTPQRLKQLPLTLPEGPLQQLLQKTPKQNLLLIFADPGKEPTEHLLLEMLESAQDFQNLPCRILLLTETTDALNHPTVQLLKSALTNLELSCLQDPDALAALHRQMQVGDLRLPFVICTDTHSQGVYAEANYRIRMAQTLLDIQKLLAPQQ